MRWLMSDAPATPRAYRVVVPLLGVWLALWVWLSWAAIQDDALIHLRYANNLYLYHFLTYDGVHANYGASSLLYVGLLALLRGLTASPQLARGVSSVVHLSLFAGLAMALELRLPRPARTARLAGLVLLGLLVTPSAVRWLDDGMETGLVVSVVTALAWMIHERFGTSRVQAMFLGTMAFLAVLLRTELLLLCGVSLGMFLLERSGSKRQRREPLESIDLGASIDLPPQEETSTPVHRDGASSICPVIAIAAGAGAAVAVIVATMRVFLPDTALAKSHGIGHWINPIHDTAVTLTGAFSFGLGMLIFWLLTFWLATRRRGLTLGGALANCFCPAVLVLSSLRGQEIQGVRYFAWTFAFSIMWNILELARAPDALASRKAGVSDRSGAVLLFIFVGLVVVELPIESLVMHSVLARRSATMRVFEAQHLEVLRTTHGVASDIGYIGYFTGAEICDLAGLVNGRKAARLSSQQRVDACAQTRPEFIFGNSSQIGPMAARVRMDDWKMCGQYDFANVRTADRHYLMVRPELAEQVCRATGRQPQTLAAVFSAAP